MGYNFDDLHEDLREAIAKEQRQTIAQTGVREAGIAWLGNEAGVVIIPPSERRHPAEAFWAYADINGTRQVIRLANYDAALTYSNKDKHRAVRIGIPPSEEILGVLGIATLDAKVFGPALPSQVQSAKQTYLTPDRFQMLRLSPGGERWLQIEAGWFYDGGTLRYIESGDLVDLDSYYPTTPGETRLVLVGWTETDTVRVLQGDAFVLTNGDSIMNHLPASAYSEGDLPLGGALLVYGETTLEQKRILPFGAFFSALRKIGIVPIDEGGTGFDASTVQGFIFWNLGTAYGVHCVGDATVAPTVNDDSADGFGVLSQWAMSVSAGAAEDRFYVCVDATAGAAVWLRLDGSGGGGMTSFTVAADSGTPAEIGDGETVTLTGGTGLSSVMSGNTVTVNLDDTAVTPGSYNNSNVTVDAQGRITAITQGAFIEHSDTPASYPGNSNRLVKVNNATNAIEFAGNSTLTEAYNLTLSPTTTNSGAPLLTSDNWAAAGEIRFRRAQGTRGSSSALTSGQEIGRVSFYGYVGTNYSNGGYIAAEIDGTPGATDIPTRLVFYISPDGSATPAEALRIANNTTVSMRRVLVDGTTPSGLNAISVTAAVINATGGSFAPAISSNVNVNGLDILPTITPTAALTGAYGVRFAITVAGSFNVDFVAGMYGGIGLHSSYSGTIANAVAGYFNDAVKPGTGAITTQYGVYIVNQTKGANKYGLVVEQTTGYAIYASGAGAVYFGGGVTLNSYLIIGGGMVHNGTTLGFFGAAAATKPTITGSRGGNAALADLLTELATLGLITDSSTA